MASDDQPKPGESITLDSLQHDILIPQIQAFLDATNDPQAREVYQALKAAIESLEVQPDLQLRLGAIVEVALTSGRVRRLFGPGAELSLNALFLKTPRGREVAKSLAELNKALATLKGQTIEQITSTQRSPGAYALTIKTDNCQIVIRFEQSGVRVESLEVDLAR
ncbi:MAG: hypothetical protein ABSD30_14640 [Candidatus Binatus sp.]|jgi:hypothetical protein